MTRLRIFLGKAHVCTCLKGGQKLCNYYAQIGQCFGEGELEEESV